MSITVDGGVLCGGLSRRMRGPDKGLINFQGTAMVVPVCETLATHTRRLIINCNQNQAQYRKLGFDICSDIVNGFKGPLAGIHSILSHASADYVLIAPCDTPMLSHDYPRKMITALTATIDSGQPAPKVLVASSNSTYHPLHICLATHLKDNLEQYLSSNHLKVLDWLNAQRPLQVNFSNSEQFSNINTPEQLYALSPDKPKQY